MKSKENILWVKHKFLVTLSTGTDKDIDYQIQELVAIDSDGDIISDSKLCKDSQFIESLEDDTKGFYVTDLKDLSLNFTIINFVSKYGQ